MGDVLVQFLFNYEGRMRAGDKNKIVITIYLLFKVKLQSTIILGIIINRIA
jgi:hypothetical protein